LWRFSEKPRNFQDWNALQLYIKSSSEKVIVVCDMASFYSIFTDSLVATVPFAPRLRDEADRLHKLLPSFDLSNSFISPSTNTYGLLVSSHIKKSPVPGERSLGIHYRRTDMTNLGVNVSILLEIIHHLVRDYSVSKIFIATDAEEEELGALRSSVPPEIFITCAAYNSSLCILPEERLLVEEGICMRANYFLGSPGSSVSILIHEMRINIFGHHASSSVLTNPDPYFGSWIPRLGDWGWGPQELMAFASQLYATRKPKPHEVF